MAEEMGDEIVRLAHALNPAEAHIWEQALRDAGIRCKVVGDYLDAGLGDISGIRPEIWVHRDDLERAQKTLEQHRRDNESEEPTGDGS